MIITPENIAVLDRDKDGLLSRWVEENKRLDHSEYIREHFAKYIKPGDVVIDAGAAIGDHTIVYAQACGDPRNVHAFEPNPLMLECLLHNCLDCCIHPIALSDAPGKLWLKPENLNAGASYITNHADDFHVAPKEMPIEVDAGTLDNCFEWLPWIRVNFIKLDIEGYEVRAIKGGIKTISRCKPQMMIEVNPWMLKRAGNSSEELFQLLTDLGYGWRIEMGDVPDGTPDSRGEYFCYPK